MKKGLFIAALAMVSLASCKKDRVCECTDSSGTQKYTLIGVTSSTAKKACVSYSEKTSSGGTETTTCTLK